MADSTGFLKSGLLVATGGAIGAMLRHITNLLTVSLAGDYSLFIATAIENMAGSFLIGFIFSLPAKKTETTRKLNLFLLTGVIGSYTTYSGFMIDAFLLLNESSLIFLIYFFGQVFFGLIFVFAGMKAGNRIMKK